MFVERITSEGLAHHSYMVGSGGIVAVIDPKRDIDDYLHIAREKDHRITHIFETHKNEDYVIGSLELAARTGAQIYHGAALDFAYGNPVHEGDLFMVGNLELRILETPGHTDESISITMKDRSVADEVLYVFTGDTLFAGDAGRTDFYGEKARERMSTLLYESIIEKILPLGDGTIVCPAHGAGSVCAVNIADLDLTTVGYEKKTSRLLQMTREEFIAFKVTEHHYCPPYFRKMEDLNKNGAPLLHTLPDPTPFSPGGVAERQAEGAQIVDLRSPPGFAGGHIPGSVHIPQHLIPIYAGWLLSYDAPIILVDARTSGLETVVRYLIRLDYDNISGYLAQGFSAWFKAAYPIETIETWDPATLRERLDDEELFLLDVRSITNREQFGYIRDAHHIYLGELPARIDEVPDNREVLVYCDAGFKGSVGASLLKKHGHQRVANLLGGMNAWLASGHPANKD